MEFVFSTSLSSPSVFARSIIGCFLLAAICVCPAPVKAAEPFDAEILMYKGKEIVTIPDDLYADLQDLLTDIPAAISQDQRFTDNRKRFHPDELPALKDRVFRHYASRGFFSAVLDSVVIHTIPTLRWYLYIDPGCPYQFSETNLHWTETEDKLSTGEFHASFANEFFNQYRLHSELSRLVRELGDMGYLFASAEVVGFIPEPYTCSVQVDILLDPGERQYAHEVIISGLKKNQERYVRSRTGIRPGQTITSELIKNGRNHLLSTQLFESVSEGQLVQTASGIRVEYEVREFPLNHFDLVMGMAPTGQGGLQWMGRGEVKVRNAGWAGNRLMLSFDRLDQNIARIDSRFESDWIKGTSLGAGVRFSMLQQDTSYQVRSGTIHGSFSRNSTNRFSLHLLQERVSASRENSLDIHALSAITRAAGVGYRSDTRNDPLNPSSGLHLSIYSESGIKRITDPKEEKVPDSRTMIRQKVKAGMQALRGLSHRQALSFRLHGSAVITAHPTESDLIRVGGSQSIRGYREEQFRVSRSAWTDLEYRYLLDRASHAFLFCAAGYVKRPKISTARDDSFVRWLRSAGFGFRYRTPIGLMQFSYAVSDEDLLHNGKVHFNLISRF